MSTSENDITKTVKGLVDLTDSEVRKLQSNGVKTEADMTFLTVDDYDDSMVKSVVKRRKLDMIGRYLSMNRNNVLADTTTMVDIRDVINQAQTKTSQIINNTYTGSGSSGSGIDSGAPKVYTDPLSEFSGDPIDYEEWQGKSEATLRQTPYRTYLDRAPGKLKPAELARDIELYNMILQAVRSGHAYNMVDKVKDDPQMGESGFYAWKTLKKWYMDPSQQSLMADHYTTKLEDLYLDKDTTATEFINSFDIYVRKIEKFDSKWSDAKKIREFLKRIVSEDYEIEKRNHQNATSLDVIITAIRRREQTLDSEAIVESNKTRRFKRKNDSQDDDEYSASMKGNDERSSSSKQVYKIPFMPGFLYKTLDPLAKKNLRIWKEKVNAGQTMTKDDLVLSKEKGKDKSGNDKSSTKGKQKQYGKQRRLTTQAASGLPDDVVKVKLNSDDEEYLHCLSSLSSSKVITSGYDSRRIVVSGLSSQDASHKIRRGTTSVAMSKGRRELKPAVAVIDSGASQDLVGGVGWRILYESKSRKTTLDGAVEGMGSITLP